MNLKSNEHEKDMLYYIPFCAVPDFQPGTRTRCLPGMKGLQVTGGMADGVHWNSKSDFAYYFGAALSTYTKNGNRWVIGGEYLEKHYPIKICRYP